MTNRCLDYSDFEVGQTVRHSVGFIGEVVAADGGNLIIRVEKHENMSEEDKEQFPIGYRYIALPRYVDEILPPKNSTRTEKLTIDVEVNGLNELTEQLTDVEDILKDITLEAEFLADLKKEESVFNVELGNGVKFEGTKSDFEAFIAGMKELAIEDFTI